MATTKNDLNQQSELRTALINQIKEENQKKRNQANLTYWYIGIGILAWIIFKMFIVGLIIFFLLFMVTLLIRVLSPIKLPNQTIIEEYKRTCNHCKKEWHSLVSKETELEVIAKQNLERQTISGLGMMNEALTGDVRNGSNTAAASASSHAYLAASNSLSALRKCPSCGSTDFKQEFYYYENK